MPVLFDERQKHADIGATYGKGRHAGALAASSWLAGRALHVPPYARWEVSIALDVVDAKPSPVFRDTADTRFHIAIASNEWGFFFCHHSRISWIRVTDLPFVHERDDYELLSKVPPLRDLGKLVQSLEERYQLRFRREHAAIRSTIPNAEENVRIWCVAAL